MDDIKKLLDVWFAYFGEEQEPLLVNILSAWITTELKKGCVSDSPLFLRVLNAVVLERHPRQYRRLPGVAELDKLKFEVWARYNDEIQRTSTAKQIPELYMQADELDGVLQGLSDKLRYRVDKD